MGGIGMLDAGGGCMNDEEVRDLIREAIQFVNPELGSAELTPASSLSELGISSVVALEIIGYIEDKLNLRFPDDELAGLNTLAALERLIRSHLNAAQAQ
jgi:acyl carrier protein